MNHVAKMREPLPIRWSRTLPRKTEPSTRDRVVSLRRRRRWHVSILVEDHPPSPPEGTQSESTWEWTATPSPATGDHSEPTPLQETAECWSGATTLSRKTKGSNNRRKAVSRWPAPRQNHGHAPHFQVEHEDNPRTKRWYSKTST